MVGEALAGLSALKTAFDMAKGLKDIDDAVRRNAAVIELQEKILSAQQAQAALVEQVGKLEKEVANLKAWDAVEREKYELKEVDPGALAYVLKPDANKAEPPHWLCATCYGDRKKSFLQYSGRVPKNKMASEYKCQRQGCGASIRVDYKVSPSGTSETPY